MIRLITCAIALTLFPQSAVAQQPSGESLAAHRLRELVRAINSGSRDSVKRFVSAVFAPSLLTNISADDRANRLSGFYFNGGALTITKLEMPDSVTARAFTKSERTEVWRNLTISVEPGGERRIANIGLSGGAPPTDGPKRTLTDAQVAAELKAYVERIAKGDDFSGTVLLAKDGKTLYSGAYGIADKNFNVPNRIDTKFNLGSMNKMFTSVAIAQLVEQGKLSFDDPVSKYLPNALDESVGDKVRIKHLLTHTSGLGSYFTEEWDGASRARYRTVDDFMAFAKKEKLQFEPGTRWSYSNTGMLVLGKVIEVVSGQNYFDYIREHIYKPAGMINSDAYELDFVTPNLAVGYEREMTPNGPRWRNNIFMHVIKGGPAGGGYSTAEDLLRFDVALRSGKLVGKKYVEMLTTPKPEISSPNYGYGFGIFDGGRIVGHSGGFPGISSNLDMYLQSGYTVVVMSNYGTGMQPVQQKARSLLATHLATSH